MTLTIALLSYLVALSVFALLRKGLTIKDVVIFYITVQFISVILNGRSANLNFYPAMVFSLGIFALTFGFVTSGNFYIISRSAYRNAGDEAHKRLVTHWLIFILFFMVYHYVVGGIPLISDDLSQLRFDQNRSGLMGIPGRLTMYGPAFLAFYVCAYESMKFERPNQRLILMILGIASIGLILNGHKSSLLVILQILIICISRFVGYRRTSMQSSGIVSSNTNLISMPVLMILTVFSLGAVFTIGMVQTTVIGSDISTLDRLYERISYSTGKPFFYLLDTYMRDKNFFLGGSIVGDLKFLISTLVPGVSLEGVNTQQLVSASMHDRDIGLAFIVPITLTIFGQFYIDFGIAGVVFGSLIYGFTFGLLINNSIRAKSPFLAAVLMYAQLFLFMGITKGNLYFTLASGAFALTFIYILYLMAKFTSRVRV